MLIQLMIHYYTALWLLSFVIAICHIAINLNLNIDVAIAIAIAIFDSAVCRCHYNRNDIIS